MRTQTLRTTRRGSRRQGDCEDKRVEMLFIRYQRGGDLTARDALIEDFMPLARRLARRYADRNEPLDDLVQVASLGLLKAIDRFDVSRGRRFSTYAVPTILGELRRHFRDATWALHVPRGAQESVLEVTRALEYLSSISGHSPSLEQVATYLHMSTEDVVAAMEASTAYDTVSLDRPAGPTDDGPATLVDSFGEVDRRYDVVEHTVSLAGTLRALPPRQRSILYMRFVADLTQVEIAERIGISQMHVSRLIRQALDRLRAAAEAGGSPNGAQADRDGSGR
jgi:RNA polymerase sigma-B factor